MNKIRNKKQKYKFKKPVLSFNKTKVNKQKKIKPIKSISKTPYTTFLEFFNSIDGVYSSYWVGKLISTLQRRGNKKTIAKHIYNSFKIIKYVLKENPLVMLLELLDKVRPTFRLRNYIVRRVIIKEYPIVSLRPRQMMIATRWLASEIQSNTGQFGLSLADNTAKKFIEFKLNPKKNNLIKKRTEYTRRTVVAQFNIRFTWR